MNGQYIAPTAQSKLETVAVLANATQLVKAIFQEISGNEISTLDHSDESLEILIATSLNQEINAPK